MIEQRALGRTGLAVTPIGLGLAALGRPGYINLGHADDMGSDTSVAAMQARAHAALDAAWDSGVRYFDAARSYGLAEQFLAAWLTARQIEPGAVTVGSKWGYTYTANWQVDAEVHEVKEHSLAVLRRQRAESDALLGAHLDLYQIHSATLSSGVLGNAAVLDELARYRDNGLFIGLSLSGPNQGETLRRALAVERGGRPLFDAVQITWNILEPSASPALAEARAAGMGIIVKEALANGRLTPRNPDPALRAILDSIAAEYATTIDALALAAVLAQPWVSVALSGAAAASQIASNLAALDLDLRPDTLERLLALAEPPDTYWQTRGNLAWN
jgi:aryl-alcohol dehydrogenase-like predicted oxidoreductase